MSHYWFATNYQCPSRTVIIFSFNEDQFTGQSHKVWSVCFLCCVTEIYIYIYFLAGCKFTICNCIFWKFELDLPFNLRIHLIPPVANCRMAKCTEDKTFQNAIRILLTIPQGPLPAAHWSDVADLSLIWCPCACTNSMDPDVPVAILLSHDYCGIIKTILDIDGQVRPFGHVLLCGCQGVSQPRKGL